ncbi:MAG: wax ester/triacylglycerol synthase family O-acyltransferase [Rhodocyclaceae bacterium]|jgi:diacylglycerol O-acyltransferase|nr:wax ester/triacylglycerol synthase family O-acyltransferase [Rhodocyclaceae bacterium]MCA3083761.1 wax ester/triacylglycerol synthase family O-acyltransferase [Rhodocyclaceae bacterium]
MASISGIPSFSVLGRERMTGVDTAWLRMEHPTNLMMIVGVMMFKEPLSFQKLKTTIEQRFLSYPRFKQKAVQDPTGAWWENDKKFELANHIKKIKLPGKGTKSDLEDYVSRAASEPLDFTKPLWQFHLIENYRGGSALVTRIHHCYADGIALVSVMLSLTGESPEASLVKPKKTDKRPRDEMDFWTSVTKPMASVMSGAMKLTRSLVEQGLEIAKDPATMREFATKGVELAEELRKIAMMQPDSKTRYKGLLGRQKRVAWCDPLPLAEVKVIGKALGASINDVLLSTAAGALRDYLERNSDDTRGVELRAVVPVNLRPVEKAYELGNQFGLVFVDLPVGVEDPLDRLEIVRTRMAELKGSSQPIVAFVLLSAVGIGPKILQDQISGLIGRNATAVMTNVPGPQKPLYLAGSEIDEIEFWVPQSGGIGMGLSILTYNGKVQFGLITDGRLVPDPHNIINRFADEFEKLVMLTLMGPYGPEYDAALEHLFGDKPAATHSVPKKRNR